MASLRILVLAGGKSPEHEVSILSAKSLLEATEGTHLDVSWLLVGRDGMWLSPEASAQTREIKSLEKGSHHPGEMVHRLTEWDVVFPMIHGSTGEDGRLQALLELHGVPYMGSGVLASALCMHKAASKHVLENGGVPVAPWREYRQSHWSTDPKAVLDDALEKLTFPLFVKPSEQGSSVGITMVKERGELKNAIEQAFSYGPSIVIESGVSPLREIEISLLGNDTITTSRPGEIVYEDDFYSYETKYTPGRSSTVIPAEIPTAVVERIQELAVKSYELLGCAGFARADFLYNPETQELFFSEINTLPGFTPFSMFTKMWEAEGLSYLEIVEKLAKLAIDLHGPALR